MNKLASKITIDHHLLSEPSPQWEHRSYEYLGIYTYFTLKNEENLYCTLDFINLRVDNYDKVILRYIRNKVRSF